MLYSFDSGRAVREVYIVFSFLCLRGAIDPWPGMGRKEKKIVFWWTFAIVVWSNFYRVSWRSLHALEAYAGSKNTNLMLASPCKLVRHWLGLFFWEINGTDGDSCNIHKSSALSLTGFGKFVVSSFCEQKSCQEHHENLWCLNQFPPRTRECKKRSSKSSSKLRNHQIIRLFFDASRAGENIAGTVTGWWVFVCQYLTDGTMLLGQRLTTLFAEAC